MRTTTTLNEEEIATAISYWLQVVHNVIPDGPCEFKDDSGNSVHVHYQCDVRPTKERPGG